MYMGESDSTASQPPKPVVIAMIGRAARYVKEKTAPCALPSKRQQFRYLPGILASGPSLAQRPKALNRDPCFRSNRPKDRGLFSMQIEYDHRVGLRDFPA